MVKKIFKNTFLTSLVAVLLSVCLILFIFYAYFEKQMFKNLKDEVNLISNGIKHAGAEYFVDFKPSDGVRITWIGSDGAVLYDSEASETDMDNHSQREEIAQAFKEGEAEVIRYSDTLSQRTMYYAKLLDDGTVMRLSYGYNMIDELLITMLQPVVIVMVLPRHT